MLSRFNEKAQKVIAIAESVAFDLGHNSIGTEHLLLSLLGSKDGKIKDILEKYNITAGSYKEQLIELFGQKNTQPFYMEYTLALKMLLEESVNLAKKKNEEKVSIDTMTICLFSQEDNVAIEMLKRQNISIKAILDELKSQSKKASELDSIPDLVNLNSKAVNSVPILVQRDKEIKLLIEALQRKQKPNAILLGEPGVGKTAIVEYLAHLINVGAVPDKLKDKTIYELDISGIIAGTKYRGEFEEKLKKIIKKVKEDAEAIIFIDEIHNIIGAGGAEGAIDASNILKPYLSRNEIWVIGATTYDEYIKIIEKEKALERRFQAIKIEEPTNLQTYNILLAVKEQFSKYHNIEINNIILEKIIKYCSLYINDRYFPDKALDVLDVACVRAKNNGLSELNEKIVVDVIEDMSKVVIETESKAENLKKSLNELLLGQQEAIDNIIEQIEFIEMGFNESNKPLGVYLFVGPTGVGKTESAKQIANKYFGNKNKYIKLDMSEYSEQHAVSKIIGSPPGYVGFERQSLLVDHIRKNPHSVVVLDEVEKAHRDVLDLFLNVFDEGYFYDATKRKIDFSNAIIIMTSNLGFKESVFHNDSIGFINKDNNKESIKEEINKHFRPEFINRIDAIIYFKTLSNNTCKDLALLYLKEYQKIAKCELDEEDSFINSIINDNEIIKFGARGIKRKVKKEYLERIKKEKNKSIELQK